MILDIILLAFLAYRNGQRAKLKEQSAASWAIFTVLAWFGGYLVGTMFVLVAFYRDMLKPASSGGTDLNTQINQAMENGKAIGLSMAEHPLQGLTVLMFSFGGYLLIRYLIDRKPGKKQPEVHWMDRLKNRENP